MPPSTAGGRDDHGRALDELERNGRLQLSPPVETGHLLNAVAFFIRRYLVITDAQARALALWTLHSWAFDVADATPYLSVVSAEKESGKTRLLEVL